MKIAVYGMTIGRDFSEELSRLFLLFREKKLDVFIYEPFYQYIIDECNYTPFSVGVFNTGEDLPCDVEFLFSIGGDGTFLNSFLAIKNKSIPVIGINTGRLGFLSDISIDEIDKAVSDILEGQYIIEERSALEIETENNPFGDFNYSLNEITVIKQDTSSMINIHVYIDEEYLNTYWADGLIISTPTGSTAYSLSAGGPILTPDSKSIVISPIAPHNLTVRPIVVPDHHEITVKIEGRGQHFLVSADSRSKSFHFPGALKIRKADFKLKTLRLNDHNFYSTLRNKLMWGLDIRN